MSDHDASCPQNESRLSSQEPSPLEKKGKQCPYCSRRFVKADHYTRHIRSHTKEKPFRCDVCHKTYPRHDTLLRHARTHKPDSQNFGRHGRHQTWSSRHYSRDLSLAAVPAPVVTDDFSEAASGSALREASVPAEAATDSPPGLNVVAKTTSPMDSRSFRSLSGIHDSGVYHISAGMNPLGGAHTLHNAGMSLLAAPELSNMPSTTEPAAFIQSFAGMDSNNWLLEDDFDLSVFDNLNYFQTPDPGGLFGTDNYEHSTAAQRPVFAPRRSLPHVFDLRHVWYTQVPLMASGFSAGSGTVTPQDAAGNSVENLDESYRAKLASSLRPPYRDEPLPTIEFMNLCINLFFRRFNVGLPIVHGPTFRPTSNTALLVLSICSAGTLCLGSDLAARTGCMLFERVNKAHLIAPWERYLSRKPDVVRATLKASMIGQTFALISEHPFHLTTASSFHGTLLSVARHAKLLAPAPPFSLPQDLSPEELEKTWVEWAQREEMKRCAMVLHIHDAELTALFHHEPILRYDPSSLPLISSTQLFNAPSAAAWAARFREEERTGTLYARLPPRVNTLDSSNTARHIPMLVKYAALSGIGGSIAEWRHLKPFATEMMTKFERDLISWYHDFPELAPFRADQGSAATDTPFSLLPLWHYSFMTLMADVNLLEIAIGKEGPDVPPSVRERAYSWINSEDSKRCLLHALLLQNLMANTSMGSIIPIYAARVLFAAAVCWACYMLYSPHNPFSPDDAPELDTIMSLESLPEIRVMDSYARNSTSAFGNSPLSTGKQACATLKSILAANGAEMKAATLCVLETTLRRLGMSPISRRFADIIQNLIGGDTKEVWMD